MNYQLKNNLRGSHSRYKKPLQITLAIAVVLLLLRIILPNVLFSLLSILYAPIWRVGDSIGIDGYFSTRSTLISENAALNDRLISLSGASDSIAVLEQENAELKEMLGRIVPKVAGVTGKSGATSTNLTLAAVLKTPPVSSYDSLIIDLGSQDGVNVGDKVYALASTEPGDTTSSSTVASTTSSNAASSVLMPVGAVSAVSLTTASVKLYSDSGQKFAVEIGPDHIPATAVAQGGGMFEADLAQGAHVKEGDAVTVPSIETITFGSVGHIINDAARPYLTVLFQQPVNVFQLRWVEVQHE